MAGSSGPRRPDTVNETAFQAIILDLAMKIELRKHLQSQDIPNFKTEVKKDILENGMLHFIGQYCHATGRRMKVKLCSTYSLPFGDSLMLVHGWRSTRQPVPRHCRSPRDFENLSLPPIFQTLPQADTQCSCIVYI